MDHPESEGAVSPETGRNEVAAQRLAGLLESARQNNNISREQLQSELRFSLDTLNAIREGKFEALGPPIYARGFVYSYARLVGAPLDEVRTLWESLGTAHGEAPLVSRKPARAGVNRMALTGATAVVTLAVLVGPALWLHGQGMLPDWFAGEDTEMAAGPEAESTAAAPVLDVPADVEDPANAPVAAGITTLPPAALEIESMEEAVEPPLVLELYFSDDCWVEVQDANGERLEYDLARSNSRRRFEGEGPFTVFLGKADSVTVAVNGEFFDIAPYRTRNLARFEVSVSEPEPEPGE